MFRRSDYDLEIYKILINQVNHDHTRSNGNFRAFLTVNTILIAAVALLLSILLKNGANNDALYYFSFGFILIVSAAGVFISIKGDY